MRIGGSARYFTELKSQEDCEEAIAFAEEKNIPLIMLGAGSNTVFADGTIEALVVRIKSEDVQLSSNQFNIGAGKNLAMLINEIAKKGFDLSALTGIPGTIGGAIFGNAGQGPKGIWIDSFVDEVTVFMDKTWQTLSKEECGFRYRESIFKDKVNPIIWSVRLTVPEGNSGEIKENIESLLKKRLETQPHIKTSGSCFKATSDGTPAWKLIDEAGLRGEKIGGVEISEKHANFLLNTDDGTFDDVCEITKKIQEAAPEITEIEMRLIGNDGKNRE